jgi:hypothetical protein
MRDFGNKRCFAVIGPLLAGLALWFSMASARAKSIFDDDDVPPPHSGSHPASSPASQTPQVPPVPPATPTLNPEHVTPKPGKSEVTPPALSPSLPPPPREKLGPPDAAARAKATQQVKKVYQDLYTQSTTDARRTLAQAMADEAPKISKNFPAKYVLLVEAVRLASATRSVEVCQKAIGELDSSFVVDHVGLMADALKKLVDSGADDTAVVEWGMEAIDTAVGADDYRAAHLILAELAPTRSTGRSAALRSRLKAKSELLAEADRVRPALDKLKTSPEDPISNFRVGKFLCFLKHDWVKGLPYLAKCGDPKLAAAARADLAVVDDTNAKFALAGQWWDLGEDKSHSSMQGSLRERAGYWYGQVAPQLTELDKAMAERRMTAAATTAKPNSPGNILNQMIVMDTTPTVVGGDIELKAGRLKAPFEVAVPFRADIVAKTDSQIRLGFMEAEIIFNWQDNKDKLYQGDPVAGQGKPSIFTGKGEIPVNTFVTLTWIVQEDGSHIFVDGKERATVVANYKGLKGPFYVVSKFKAVICVRSVSITPAR